MKLEELLQKIDKEVLILINFCYFFTIKGISYEKKQVYYSGKLEDISYQSLRDILGFEVQKVSLEKHEQDTKISITI